MLLHVATHLLPLPLFTSHVATRCHPPIAAPSLYSPYCHILPPTFCHSLFIPFVATCCHHLLPMLPHAATTFCQCCHTLQPTFCPWCHTLPPTFCRSLSLFSHSCGCCSFLRFTRSSSCRILAAISTWWSRCFCACNLNSKKGQRFRTTRRNLTFDTSKILVNCIRKMMFCVKIGNFQFRKSSFTVHSSNLTSSHSFYKYFHMWRISDFLLL